MGIDHFFTKARYVATVHRLAKGSAPGGPYHTGDALSLRSNAADCPPHPSAIGSSGAGVKSNITMNRERPKTKKRKKPDTHQGYPTFLVYNSIYRPASSRSAVYRRYANVIGQRPPAPFGSLL